MRRDQRGFTLLELIIALAIVGALLAVAFGGMRVALAAWRKGEDRADAHQHARGVALSLARAIGATYPYSASRGDGPDPKILFLGDERHLEFVTEASPFPFPIPIAFTAVVIELGDGEHSGLIIRQRALPNWNPFTDATEVLRDLTVRSLVFGYMDDTGAWRESWDADSEKAMPRAVRITVGADFSGRTETLPPMTIPLRIQAP